MIQFSSHQIQPPASARVLCVTDTQALQTTPFYSSIVQYNQRRPRSERSTDGMTLAIRIGETSPCDISSYYVPHPDRFYDRLNYNDIKHDLHPSWNPFMVGICIIDQSSPRYFADLYHLIVCGEDGPCSGTFHNTNSWSYNLLRYGSQSFSHTDYDVQGLFFSVGVPDSNHTQEVIFHIGKSFYRYISDESSAASFHNYSRLFGASQTFVAPHPMFVSCSTPAGILKNKTTTHSREFLRFAVTSPKSNKTDPLQFAFTAQVKFDPLSTTQSNINDAISFEILPPNGSSCWYTSSTNPKCIFMIARTDSVSRVESKTNATKTTETPYSYLIITAGTFTDDASRTYFVAHHAMLICVPKLAEFPTNFCYKWCTWKILFTKDNGIYDPSNPHLTQKSHYPHKSLQVVKKRVFSPPINPVCSVPLSLSHGSIHPPAHAPDVSFNEIYYRQSPPHHIPVRPIHSIPNYRRFNAETIRSIAHLFTSGVCITENGQCIVLSPPTHSAPVHDVYDVGGLQRATEALQVIVPDDLGDKIFIYKDNAPCRRKLDKSDIALLKILALKHASSVKIKDVFSYISPPALWNAPTTHPFSISLIFTFSRHTSPTSTNSNASPTACGVLGLFHRSLQHSSL